MHLVMVTGLQTSTKTILQTDSVKGTWNSLFFAAKIVQKWINLVW